MDHLKFGIFLAPFHAIDEHSTLAMEESLEALIPLLNGEIVNKKTDWFELRDAQLKMTPYTQPTVEMAVAAANSPVGDRMVGKCGIGMLSVGTSTDKGIQAARRNWEICEHEAARYVMLRFQNHLAPRTDSYRYSATHDSEFAEAGAVAAKQRPIDMRQNERLPSGNIPVTRMSYRGLGWLALWRVPPGISRHDHGRKHQQ